MIGHPPIPPLFFSFHRALQRITFLPCAAVKFSEILSTGTGKSTNFGTFTDFGTFTGTGTFTDSVSVPIPVPVLAGTGISTDTEIPVKN
jgi:hypothetical protein